MDKGVYLNQRHRIILRLVGGVLAVAACCTILVVSPKEGSVSVAAVSTARNTAVAHMRLMGTTRWIPSQTWNIETGTKKMDGTWKIDDYLKGKIYKGMPYSQYGCNVWSEMRFKFTSLYLYVSVNESKNIYNCQVTTSSAQKFGNDCAKAVFQSWKQAGSGVPIVDINTQTMVDAIISPQYDMKKVGNYTTGSGYSTYSMTNSYTRKEDVKAAYNLLQPGDALVQDYDTKGHAILVRYVNSATKTVYTIEQIGSRQDGSRLDNYYSTWIVTTYSYQTLVDNHYVPLTADFSGW
ncbi:MAG: hypothetical protein JW817_00890 [Clostridiales bacterium]|nr:hypothetical protein [Clostridiales bacterium]